MKKTLGLLALTLAVSSVASAQQDFLKKIAVDTNASYTFTDRDVKMVDGVEKEEYNRPGIGNEGFKQVNRTGNKFEKKLSGTVVLHDESKVMADFYVEHNDETQRAGRKVAPVMKEEEGKMVVDKHARTTTIKQGIKLYKDVKIKDLDTSWYAKYDGEKTRNFDAERNYLGSTDTKTVFEVGTSYKPFSQPKSLFGLEMKHGASYEVKKANDEWKLFTEANFSREGKIAKVPGELSYSFGFDHKFSHIGSKLEDKKVKRSNLELEYKQGLKHEAMLGKAKLTSTVDNKFKRETNKRGWSFEAAQKVKLDSPSFYGFTGSVALDNKFERKLIGHEAKNTFKIPVELSYKHDFNTAAGVLSVKPFANYDLLVRETKYNKDGFNNVKSNKRLTKETNSAKVGVSVALEVK